MYHYIISMAGNVINRLLKVIIDTKLFSFKNPIMLCLNFLSLQAARYLEEMIIGSQLLLLREEKEICIRLAQL